MFCIVMVTAPQGPVVKKIINVVLKNRLAACVNVIVTARSSYWWKGKIRHGRESLLILKTRRSLFKKLEALLASVHPYETPEIISVTILRGNRPYLRWLADETKPRS